MCEAHSLKMNYVKKKKKSIRIIKECIMTPDRFIEVINGEYLSSENTIQTENVLQHVTMIVML